MNKVLIGVPNGGSIKAETVSSLLNLIASTDTAQVIFMPIQGGYKTFNMNRLVEVAKRNGCSHLLNIDADMIFPEDTLKRLLAHNKDIVGGNYRYRGAVQNQDNPPSVVKFKKDNKYIEGDIPDKLFECAALGLGMLLFKTKVFDKLKPPYFELDEVRPAMEDVIVCEKLRAKNYKIFCDPTIRLGHIGTYIY